MKTGKKISGYVLRSAVVAALFSTAIVGFTSAFNLPGRWANPLRQRIQPTTQARTLTFADRVAYQRASAPLNKFTGDIGIGRTQLAARSHRSIN